MKITAFILSVFVLSLSLVPCSDAHTCDDLNNEVPVEISTSHDHSEDHGDDCTTLCSCSCCGIHITAPENANGVLSVTVLLSDHQTIYTSSYTFQPLTGIWHPPSLG